MVIFIKNDSINENIKRATQKKIQTTNFLFRFSFHKTYTYWDMFVAVVNCILNRWWKCSHIPLWCKSNIQIQLERHYLVLFPFYALPRARLRFASGVRPLAVQSPPPKFVGVTHCFHIIIDTRRHTNKNHKCCTREREREMENTKKNEIGIENPQKKKHLLSLLYVNA